MPRSRAVAEDRRPPRRARRPRHSGCAAASRHGTRRHRLEAEPMRVLEHARPPCPARSRTCATAAIRRRRSRDRMRQNTLRAGRGAGDLLDLGLAIDREQAHAELEGARDVALLLDRVAVGDAVGRRAGGQRHARSRRPRRCRSRSRARRAAPALPAPDWPSRRRRRACRAGPWRRRGSCRARRRGRRRGKGRRRGGSSGSHECAQSLAQFPYSVGHEGPGLREL